MSFSKGITAYHVQTQSILSFKQPFFCIVCNPILEESEYEDWAIEMSAPQGPQDPSAVHPCLYAYTNTDIETMQQCEQLICNDHATYNDMVGKNNGNFDLSPIVQ